VLFYRTPVPHPLWLRRRVLGWLMDSGELPIHNLVRRLELLLV